MVVLIMLLHGVPVYVAGVLSRKESVMTVVAIISAIIGVMTGNPKYMLNDLAAVGVAYWLGMKQIRG